MESKGERSNMTRRLPLLPPPGAFRGLDALLAKLGEGIIVLDASGRVVMTNSAAQRLLGLSAKQMHGQALETLPLRHRREDGSPMPANEHPALVALRSGKTQPGVVIESGHHGHNPVWIRLGCEPLIDAHGEVEAVVTTFVDITPHRQTEHALHRTEVRNRSLAEALAQSGGSVVITNREGRIEYVNSACCKAYGYTESELIGANPRIFKSNLTPPEVYAALWETILAGRTWRGELSNRSRDGRLIRESVSVSPVRDECGEVRHFVALKEDITQLREDERRRHELFERVARLERMEVVGALAGGVAHDFNNVLVAILGYSELAAVQLQADGRLPRVASFVDEIRIAGERARELVQQLLNFSRSETGARQQASCIVGIVQEVVSLLQATLPESITLTTEVDPFPGPLSVDPGHLHQALMNLLINARDAVETRERGSIRLVARRISIDGPCACDSCHREYSGDYIALAVSDNGPGINPDILGRIFEPFFTTKDIGRGTGMGLAVVHGVSHMYDGHVRLRSATGSGTEVEVLLPASLLDGTQLSGG